MARAVVSGVPPEWPFPATDASPVWADWYRQQTRTAAEAALRRSAQQAEARGAAARRPAAVHRIDAPLSVLLRSSQVQRLRCAGLETLGDVHRAAQQGTRWWVFAPGIGEVRAREIEAQVREALGAK